jgi:hypothetical protein
MIRTHIGRMANTRRQALTAAMALAIALVALGSFASGALAEPKGEFKVFAQCPTSTPNVEGCVVAKTEKGEVAIGKTAVPIENALTLQGGFEAENPCNFPFKGKGECLSPFVGAVNGETLSKTPENVPGGLLKVKCKEIKNAGLRLLCELFFEKGVLGVTATTELAVPPSSIGLSESALVEPVLSEVFGIPALRLPVKIKLTNATLGNSCYIGSNTEPIVLNLISGKTNPPAPNKAITGNPGTLTTNEEGSILTISGNKIVDNSFATPGANGCGFLGLFNSLVNFALGLPSAAGNNTAILEGTLKQAGAEVVKEHE